MNGTQPPLIPTAPVKKSGLPKWALVLMVLGAAGFVGIAVPNFVKARNTAQMNACISNLRLIDGVKQQWALEHKKAMADTPTQSEIVAYLKDGQLPICPAGGAYTINAVAEDPICSVPNHRFPRAALPNR